MGIDALDLIFRLEKEFGVRIPRGSFYREDEWERRNQLPPDDITAGELHERLCDIAREQLGSRPPESWRRFQVVMGACLGVEPHAVTPDKHFFTDLGAC